MSPVSHSHSASDPEPTAVPSKHPKQIFIKFPETATLLTFTHPSKMDFISIAPSDGEQCSPNQVSPVHALSVPCDVSRLLRRIGARGPALLGRAAREAAYRPIRGPHPSRFITPQYPKPVSFIRRLLRVSQSSSSRESRKNNLR